MQRQTDTEKQIKNALTNLLKNKQLETITITDITRAAHINRGTFYLHYMDKYDMMEQLISHILDYIFQLLSTHREPEELFPVTVQVLTYLKEDYNFIYAIERNSPQYLDNALNQFFDTIIENLPQLKKDLRSHPYLPYDYARQIFIRTNTEIVMFWINKGCPETPDKIAKMLLQV